MPTQNIPLYIPTYIGSPTYQPARVLPRIFFYNGLVDCQAYFLQGFQFGVTNAIAATEFTAFPYFDNYNVVTGSFPTTDSKSLLFNNERAAYGFEPTENLYTEYWERYIDLLYNPYTRLLNCSAIIPLADYFNMELNDIVQWRGNYYHLRAINNYSLKNGTCDLQLLGPILNDIISAINPELSCDFDFDLTDPLNPPTTTTTTTLAPTTTTTLAPTTTTTTTIPPGVYAYSVRLDNSTGTICSAVIVTVYSNSVLLTTGDTIYYDTSLAISVTGYDYVVRSSGPPDIYNLNPGTGVIGLDTTLDC